LEGDDDIDNNINEKWEDIKTTMKETKQQLIYRVRHKSVNTNSLLYAPGSQYIVVGGKAARNT
jgi:hypothetical protein